MVECRGTGVKILTLSRGWVVRRMREFFFFFFLQLCTATHWNVYSFHWISPRLIQSSICNVHLRLSVCLSEDDKGLTWVSKGGKDRTWPSRGEGTNTKITTNFKLRQNCVNHKFYQILIILPFERWCMIFTWHWLLIYMVSLFAWYADDIFQVVSNFYIQISKFGGKSD